ncbi:MAG: cobalamin B12-binding domain-containing protein [Thermodesulfobacteriota bacterium]
MIITASPNEFHEIGAWMLSDVLEQDGWEVRYLGADMPAADLIDMVTAYQPDVLAISVTMPFNVDKVRDLIRKFRDDPKTASLKVIVGGHVFNDIPKLWRLVGADGFASNLEEAVRIIGQWSSQPKKDEIA